MSDNSIELVRHYAKDLALLYAKARLDDAYRTGLFNDDPVKAPNHREFEYLLECFETAYNYYEDIASSNFKA